MWLKDLEQDAVDSVLMNKTLMSALKMRAETGVSIEYLRVPNLSVTIWLSTLTQL